MVDPKNKALVLPKDPRIPQVFPRFQELPNHYALPHGPDEVRVLRNMGFAVPSPVMADYDWGGTTPFKAQVVTTAMLVVEPRAYVLNTMGCVDSDTEYLSPTGWKRIADYTGGRVAQYHPDTGKAEFVEPTAFVREPCREMIHIKTARGVDQMLSPEHRMLVEHAKTGEQETIPADVFEARYYGHIPTRGKNNGTGRQAMRIPTVFHVGGSGLEYDDATIRLLVAMKADGHIKTDNPSTPVHIRLKKTRKKNRLRMLLDAAEVEYLESSKDWPTAQGYTVFKFMLPELSKTYGPRWWSATTAQKLVVADEVLHWDGSVSAGRHRFSSYDKETADYIQFVFASTGSTAGMSSRERETGTEHTVYVRPDTVHLSAYGVDNDGELKRNVTRCNSTDGYKYCFMVPSTYLVFRRNGNVFVSGNTGKTRSVLFAYDFLRQRGAVKKMLVVAPLSTLDFTWNREAWEVFPKYRVVTLHGPKAKRLKMLEQDADIYVINHDGLNVIKDELLKKFGAEDVCCIDEISAFRNARAKRSKVCRTVSAPFKYVWGLTGTPTPKEPTDAYGIIQLINPGKGGSPKSFVHFRDMLMHKQGMFKWLPRKGAQEKVFGFMQPAVRFTLDDCVDMPPVIHQNYACELMPQQKKLYKAMTDKCRAFTEDGSITAANEGVVINKLLQVSTGCVFKDDGEVAVLDMGSRLKVITELVENNDRSVIVFAPYVPLVERLYAELTAQGWNTHMIHGGVTQSNRTQIFRAFQDGGGKQVIVAHPATMSHGLTLTAANLILWAGPIWDLEVFEQANARIARPGQTAHRINVAHVVGSPVERKVFKRLKDKQSMQGVLLEMFE